MLVYTDQNMNNIFTLAEWGFGLTVLWKKGQATQEDYKDVVRLCRDKIRRAKAQLELSMDIAKKDKEKCFY